MAKLKDIINENFSTISTLGGVATIKPVNNVSSLSGLVEDKWFGEDEKKVDTGEFMQEVKNFSRLGEMIYREGSLRDVAKGLAELAEKARIATLQETDDWFDKVSVKRNMKELGSLANSFIKVAKESNALQRRMETLYEDMGNILGRYYEIKDTGSIQEKEVKNLDKPQSGGKEEYQKFFNDAMKKFGVSSPDELSDEDKKDFFNWVDKNWSNS